MANEEAIKKELVAKFAVPEGNVIVKRERRIFADVDVSGFHEIFEYAVQNMGFSILCTITGLDAGEKLSFIYHMARTDGTMLNLRTNVPKANPEHRTVSGIFPQAVLYERELIDLLGAKITGLPPGMRYPLPDDWPDGQYPLRKDWKPETQN
jgi:membrane-bound hydrogenase subunit beta